MQVEPGPNLEARARIARYQALPDDVLVGHTADDRAETVLFNIGRGAGLAGAAAPYSGVGRPLLGLRRSETHALCEQFGLPTVRDPMNDDPSFARVAIRNEAMPALARALGRDPVPLLNRHAELASQALEVVAELAAGVDPHQRGRADGRAQGRGGRGAQNLDRRGCRGVSDRGLDRPHARSGRGRHRRHRDHRRPSGGPHGGSSPH